MKNSPIDGSKVCVSFKCCEILEDKRERYYIGQGIAIFKNGKFYTITGEDYHANVIGWSYLE